MRKVGLVLGPLLFFGTLLFFEAEGLSEQGIAVLACTLWVATWWITEAVEVEVTALLPIVLFPLSGAQELSKTSSAYGHKLIFLFIGGFILAIAIQKWNLHKRIALNITKMVGTKPKSLIMGMMMSTAFLSMCISNTATTVMMLPIALAIADRFSANVYKEKFSSVLLLSVAYSASIGGIVTLIGTPPNIILAGVVEQLYQVELGFGQWLSLGLPVSLCLLVICWFYLNSILPKKLEGRQMQSNLITEEIKKLSPMSLEEKMVSLVFVLTASLWITRSFLLSEFIEAIDDSIIAIGSSLLLFLLPSSKKGEKLLQWEDAVELPWGILILFGGGIALASGFQSSGLGQWIAANFKILDALPLIAVLLIIVLLVNFLTEITSNLATTSVLLPVLAPMAAGLDVNPFYLLGAATLAASCAFMLPVATPPNAIVFGSKQYSLQFMIRKGFVMNIISVLLITILVYALVPLFLAPLLSGS